MKHDREKGLSSIRLSDDEVEQVLARASDIDAEGTSTGLSIGELHEIAEQAGIPGAALSRALAEVDRQSAQPLRSGWSWVWARETSFVPGHVGDEDLAWFIRVLDQLGQIRGGVRYEKGALVWSTPSGLDLEVSSRSRETLVSVSGDDRRHLAGAAFGFIGAGATWGTVATVFGLGSFAPATAIALGAGAGALSLGLYWRGRAAKLRAIVAKTSAGVSEVLRMVARRHKDGDDV